MTTIKHGNSLAFQKFTKTIETEIRNYWQINTALVYSKRWWELLKPEDTPKTITKYPGDNKSPFSSIDITPKEYLDNISRVVELARENSIINFITAFEVYLYDITKRIVYLKPDLITDSDMPIPANEISKALVEKDFRDWFSNRIVDKYVRNKTHLKMLKSIQGFLKYDFEKKNKDKIEEWNQWTYVRNAIVHSGREISVDLNRIWPLKFSNVGGALNLQNKDLIRVHYLAMFIAELIDQCCMELIIKEQDAEILIREIFIREGIENKKDLKKLIFGILKLKMKIPQVEKIIAFQKRNGGDPKGWRFSHHNFSR